MSTRDDWLAAAHAMQSGVAATMQIGWPESGDLSNETSPKHLRVGVNVALADMGSLVGLLIAKGIITDDEYMDAIVAGMQREVKKYEDILSEHYGKEITLG
jgi:hypothetical protein